MKLSRFLIFFLGTLSPDTNALIPTVTDSLFAHHAIPSNEIGISFEPTTTTNNLNGELTWGTYTFINYIIVIVVLTDSVTQVESTGESSLAKLRTCVYFVLNHY